MDDMGLVNMGLVNMGWVKHEMEHGMENVMLEISIGVVTVNVMEYHAIHSAGMYR